MSLMNVIVHAFSFEASGLDNFGFFGNTKEALILPYSDISEGGISQILGINNDILNTCPKGASSCYSKNSLESTFLEVEGVLSHLESQFKMTDYMPATKDGFGVAKVGWWVIPNYDKNIVAESVFDKAKSIGLTDDSWLSLKISYSKGETLTIKLRGEDINEDDSLQSAPRFSYTGVGSFESVYIPMKAIRRPSCSQPSTYDASKVTAIGLFRIEEALSEGSGFPVSSIGITNFKFACLSSGNSKGDNACIYDPIIASVLTSKESITLIGKEVQIYSVSGENVWSGLWTGSLGGFSKGLYFVKWNNQVLKFNND